jgi:hypothetical protein
MYDLSAFSEDFSTNCGAWRNQYPWDFYLRDVLTGAHVTVGRYLLS